MTHLEVRLIEGAPDRQRSARRCLPRNAPSASPLGLGEIRRSESGHQAREKGQPPLGEGDTAHRGNNPPLATAVQRPTQEARKSRRQGVRRLSAASRGAQARVEAGSRAQVSQAQQDLRAAAAKDLAAAYARYFVPAP